MKAFGLSDKFYKGKGHKQDNIKGPLKKLGYQNWWEEVAEGIDKTAERLKVKRKIKKDLNELE